MFRNFFNILTVGLLISIGIVGFCPAGLPQESAAFNDKARERYKLAQDLIGKQDYIGALIFYNLLLESYPDNNDLRYMKGLLEHKIGRTVQAENAYQYLVDRDAADSVIFNNLGVICVEQAQRDQAIQWFLRAVQEDPSLVEAHENLAQLFLQNQAYADAIAEYNKVVAIDQDNVQALYNLGVTYLNLGDIINARQRLEQALAFHPGDQDVQRVLEQVKEQQGRMNGGGE